MDDYIINPLITDYITWLETQKESSQNTLDNYKLDLEIFEKYLIDKSLSITEVTTDDIENYKTYMLKEKKWAGSTRARRIIALRNFYKYLTIKKVVKENPTLGVLVPNIPERQPVYLTERQAKKLVSMTETQAEPYSTRDRLLLLMFLTAGLRVGEMSNVKLNDITENVLTVIGKGNKQRRIGLNNDVMEALNDYLCIRPNVSEYLFISNRNQRMVKRTMQYTVDKYLELAKLDTSIYSAHKLRHTAATLMHKHGVDIKTLKEILGHEKIETTEIYTHVDDEQLQQVANVTQGMFSKKSKINK